MNGSAYRTPHKLSKQKVLVEGFARTFCFECREGSTKPAAHVPARWNWTKAAK